MLWYLLKTWAGREEELVKEFRRTVPAYLYEDIFVIYTERIWRRQGRSIVHPEPLFRGCVFLTCRESAPIWRRLEQVPFLAQWMGMGHLTAYPLRGEDVRFLKQIAGDSHMMRLSYVLREADEIFMTNEKKPDRTNDKDGKDAAFGAESSVVRYRVSGPLEYCLEDIASIEFRKRSVKLHKRLWGEDMVIVMGIVLNEDMEQGVVCGDCSLPIVLPEKYTLLVRKGTAA